MDNITANFSLGRGGRANDTTQGGRNDGNEQGGHADGNTGTMGGPRRTLVGFNDWDNASMCLQGDPTWAHDSAEGGNRPREQTMSSHWVGEGGVTTTKPLATFRQLRRLGKSRNSLSGRRPTKGAMS
jgi:hypothetical protein